MAVDKQTESLHICLCAEILSVVIRNCEDVKGLRMENEEVRISQYADDTTLFLQMDIKT